MFDLVTAVSPSTTASPEFAAAVLAASVAAAGLLWAVVSWLLTQRQLKKLNLANAEATGREQWRLRFEWSVAAVASPSKELQRAGIQSLNDLLDAPWASTDDQLLALAVLVQFEEGS